MVPTWGAEQAKDKSETCAIILSRASSAAPIHEVCEHHHSRGIQGTDGLSKATENLFVVLLEEFSFGFCIFHFSSAALQNLSYRDSTSPHGLQSSL